MPRFHGRTLSAGGDTRRRQRRFAPPAGPDALVFDPLEPRVLLNADILAVQLAAMPAEAHDHAVIVRMVEETAQVGAQTRAIQAIEVVDQHNPNLVLAIGNLSQIGTVAIRGAGISSAETVVIDADSFGANTLPVIAFTGGRGPNALVVDDQAGMSLTWRINGDGSGGISGAVPVSFSNVASLVAIGGDNTLDGPALPTTWDITGLNAGTVAGTSFSGFDHLQGAPDNASTFVFSGNGDITNGVAGGTGGYNTVQVDSGSYQTELLSATNSADGSIVLDGATIAYTGMSPIDISSGATNVTIDINGTLNLVNNVTLSGSGGMLTLSDPGGAETQSFADPTGQLTIAFAPSDATNNVTIESLGNFAAGLEVDNPNGLGTVEVTASIATGGAGFTVNAATTIVPNTEPPGSAFLLDSTGTINTGAASGPAGAINIAATDITLASGSVLDADATATAYADGTITLNAADTSYRQVPSPLIFVAKQVDLTATGATIEGGDIALNAIAYDASLPNDIPTQINSGNTNAVGIAASLNQIVISIPATGIAQLSPVGLSVIVRGSDANLTLDGATIDSTGNVAVSSSIEADTFVVAIASQSQLGAGNTSVDTPFDAAIGFARTTGTVTTSLIDGTSITAAGDVNITAEGYIDAISTAEASDNFTQGSIDPSAQSYAVAIADSQLTSTVSLSADTVVTATAGSVNIDATGSNTAAGISQTTGPVDATAGFSIGLAYAQSTITSTVNGTITAAGDSGPAAGAFNAGSSSVVDTINDSFNLPTDNLHTGQVVVYNAGTVDTGGAITGGTPIGGLVSGDTYYVIVTGPGTFQLAAAPVLALDPSETSPVSLQTLAPTAGVEFELDAVNTANNSIFLPGHSFTTGDTVVYTTGADATAIGGLTNGATYTVNVLDAADFQLENAGTVVHLSDPVGDGLGLQIFTGSTQIALAAFASIDGTANTIDLPDNSLPNGQLVHYDAENDGASDPVLGLQSAGTYTVRTLTADTFELIDPVAGTVVAIGDPGTASVQALLYNGNTETFTPAPPVIDFDAVDPVSKTIALNTSGLAVGDVVTYGILPGATAIGGLVAGGTYTVGTLGADSLTLLSGTTVEPVTPGSASGTQYFIDGSNTIYFALGSIDTATGTFTSAANGLSTGETVTYTADGAPLSGLTGGTQYTVKVLSSNAFELVDPATNAVVNPGSYAAGSFSMTPIVVNTLDDSIFLPGNTFVTGEAVVYDVDPAITSSATTTSVAQNGSVTVVPLMVRDHAIGGLLDGATYYVVVVDSSHIRLTSSYIAALDALPITLTALGSGADQTISPDLAAVNGIGVMATLSGEVEGLTSPSVGGTTSPDTAFQGILNLQPDVTISTFLGNLGPTSALSTGNAESMVTDNAGNTVSTSDPISNNSLSASGAFSVNVDLGTARATVGTDTGAHAAKLTTPGSIDVNGAITAQNEGEATAATSKPKNAGGTAVSIALAVQVMTTDAEATVGGNAVLNAGGTVAVTTSVSYPFLETPTDLIPIYGEWASEGLYSALQFFDGNFGLSDELNTWVAAVAQAPVDPKDGLPAQPSPAYSGAVSVAYYNNISEATIAPGAQVNQDTLLQTPSQAVDVESTTTIDLLQLGGQMKFSLSESPFISGSGLQAPTAVNNFIDAFGRSGSTAIGGALLVTAIIDQTEALIDPNAAIHVGSDPDAGLTVTSNESIINIEAAEAGGSVTGSDTTAFAGSGIGNGQNSTTLAGLVADDTGGPTITGGGTITIAATTGGTAIALAGALVSSDGGNSGVGVSLVINAIIRQTDAFIGLNPTTGTVAPTGTVTLDAGAVSLTATTTGGIGSATIAGVLAKGESDAAPATQSAGGGAPTQTAPTAGAAAPANLNDQDDTSSAVGVAGAGVGQGVNDTTLASIDAPGTADITALTQTATDTGVVFGLAGAVSLQLDAGEDEGSKTIAGAIDVNVVIADTAADLQGLDVNTTDPANTAPGDHAVSLSAVQQGTLVSLAVAVAADTSSVASPGESQSFAGSLAISYVTSTTQALVEAAAVIAAGTMSLTATQGADVIVIGGGLSYSDGDLGLGASLAFNLIQANTMAGIVGGAGGRPDVDLAGNLSAVAINTDDITSVAVSAGVTSGEGGTAAAFTLAINVIAPDTSAFTHANADALTATITDADVRADGTITLTAQDNSNIVAVAGALAVGADSNAFGVGAGWNQIALQISATIDDATVAGDGGISLLAESTATDAPLDGKIVAAALSGAVSSGTAVGAAVSVDGVLNTIDAAIEGGSTVTADDGTISITATDTAIIRTLVGGLAATDNGNGAGAAIGADYIDNLVTAEINGSTVSGQAIAINADEDADIGALTLGLAGAAENALGGSVSIDVISDTVNADINGASRVNATGTIDVASVNDARITATAGALAIAFGGVGVGASVTTVVVVNNNNAFVAGDAIVAGIGGVAITASTTQTIANSAIGGAVGSDAAITGSLPVTGLNDTTQAYVGTPDSGAPAGAGVRAGTGTGTLGNVLIAATSVLTLIGTAGALAASAGVGVGIGAAAGGANRKTNAFVGQGATVTADGSVLIEADATEEAVANSVAGSGGATAGVSLTAGISAMVLTTTATIGNNAVVSARGNVVVSAQDDTISYQLSGNVTGGGSAAVGVAVGISTLNKTTQATIDPGAQVTALALGPAVETNTAGFTAIDGSDAQQTHPQVTFNASAVGQGGAIDAPANGLRTGDQVIYAASGNALGGLDDGSVYYVISLDADHFELAQTYADAQAGIAIPVTQGMANAADKQSLNVISGGGVPALSATSLDTSGISAFTVGPEATAARTGVIVVAASTNVMENTAIAVAGSGGVAVPIGGSVAVDTIDTDAEIQAGAAINPTNPSAGNTQDVYVDAARSYRAIAVGLGGGGAGAAAIAPGVAVPVLEGNTEALISGPSTGTATTVGARGDIEVAALATEAFVAVAVGVAGAGVAAVGGSVAVVAMDTTTIADISGLAVVAAGGNVLVAASDATTDYAIAGAAGLAIGGAAGAGAFAVTQLQKTTDALIESGAIVDASADSVAVIPGIPTGAPAVDGVFPTAPVQGVAVAATSSETVTDGAGSGAGGLYAGLAGAVTVEIITANTLAAIRSGAQVNANVAGFGNTQPGVSVTAVDTVNEVAVAGALGVGGVAGVGAGVDVAILRDDTQAVIDNAAVAAAGATNVLALTVRNLSSTPVAAGAALGLGLGGGIAVLSIGGDFSSNYSATDASGNTDTSNPLSGNGSDVLSQVNSGIGTLLQALTQPNGGGLPPVDPSIAVSHSTINFGTATGLTTGEAVTFSASGYTNGETTGGLTVGDTYFVIATDQDHIQLALSYDDAVAGNAVQLNAATGSWTFTAVTGTALGNQATTQDGPALPDNAVANAEDSTATDSGTTAAIKNGAAIATASLNVIGSQTYDIEVHAGAAAFGALGALGVGIAVVSATADVSATIAPDVGVTALGTPGAVTVAASNDGLLHVLGFAGSVGGLISLGAAVASVTDASNVSALIGASVDGGTLTEGTSAAPTVIQGGFTGVTVRAEASPTIDLSTGAASASLGTGAGASITSATIGGNVVAEIGNATTITGGTAAALGALDVAAERSATIGPFDSTHPEGIGLSGGLVSGTAGVVDETIAGNVQADVGNDAVINIGGAATISANGTTNANLQVDGGALGAAAIGVMVGALDISGTVSATVGAAGSLRAQSIGITANGTNTAYAIAYPAGGGVFGSTEGGSSNATLTPSVIVSLGTDAALIATGGDITLAATSTDSVEADIGTTNAAAGVAIGALYTQFDYAGTVVARIGADALVQASGNVAISAISNDLGTSTASGGGGAIIGVQTDQSTGTFDVATTIEVEADATIIAGDALTLLAQSTVEAAALTPSLTAGGLGAGANVQGTLTVTDQTLVRLDDTVILQAPTVALLSDIASLTALSMPQGTADGAIVGADATGNLTVTAMSIVSIDAGDSIAASNSASFIASFETLSAQGTADAQANGLGGGQAFTSLNVNALTEVYGDPAATVATNQFAAEARQPALPTLGSTQNSSIVGFLDQSTGAQSAMSGGTVDWSSTLIITPAPDRAALTVNAAGTIVIQNLISASIAGGTIVVNNVTADPSVPGSVLFNAPAADVAGAITQGVVTGSPTIEVQTGISAVDITNLSSLDLRLNQIALSPPPSTGPASAVQIVNGTTSTFTPDIIGTSSVTTIDVQSAASPLSDVLIGGSIANPNGLVIINAGSSIVEAGGAISADLLDLDAGGSAGTAAAPIVLGSADLNAAIAGGGLWINATGTVGIGGIVVAGTAGITAASINGVVGATGILAAAATLDADEGAIGSAALPVLVSAPGSAAPLTAIASDGIVIQGGGLGLAPQRVTASTGDVLLSVPDQVGSGQNITVGAASIVRAVSGSVTLLAGDNVTIAAGGSVGAADTVTIGDNVTGAGGNPDTLAGTIDVAGVIGAPAVFVDNFNLAGVIALTNTQAGSSTTINTGNVVGATTAVLLGSDATPTSDIYGELHSIAGAVTIDGTSHAAAVTLDDTGNYYALQVNGTLSGGTLTGLGLDAPIVFNDIGTLQANLGYYAATVDVESIPSATDIVLDLKDTTGGIVDVGTGGHTLSGIAGLLSVLGSGNDRLAIDNSGATLPTLGQLTANALTGVQMGNSTTAAIDGTAGIFFSNLGSVSLSLGAGADHLTITGVSAPTTINTGAGGDAVTVTSLAQLAYPLSISATAGSGATLAVAPTGGSDLVVARLNATTGTLYSASDVAQGFNFSNQSALDITQGSANDGLLINDSPVPVTAVTTGLQSGITVTAISQALSLTLGGSLDAAQILAATGAVNVTATGSADSLDINLANTSLPVNATLTNGAFTGLLGGTLDFAGLAKLTVELGSGNNAVSINESIAHTAITLSGGGGNNSFTVDQANTSSNPPLLTLLGGTGQSTATLVIPGVPTASEFLGIDFSVGTLTIDDLADTNTPITWAQTDGGLVTAAFNGSTVDVVNATGATTTNVIGGTLVSGANTLDVTTDSNDDITSMLSGDTITLAYGGDVVTTEPLVKLVSNPTGTTFNDAVNGSSSYSNGGLTVATTGSFVVHAGNASTPTAISASGTSDVFTITGTGGLPFSLYSIELAVPAGKTVPSSLLLHYTTAAGITGTDMLTAVSGLVAGGTFTVEEFAAPLDNLTDLVSVSFTPGVLEIGGIVGLVAQPGSLAATPVTPATFTLEAVNNQFVFGPDNIATGTLLADPNNGLPDQSITGFLNYFYEAGNVQYTDTVGNGAQTLTLIGNLMIPANEIITVTGGGAGAFILQVDGNVTIGAGAVVNVSANGTVAGPGGGVGGIGYDNGGAMYESGEYGVVGSTYAAGGTGGPGGTGNGGAGSVGQPGSSVAGFSGVVGQPGFLGSPGYNETTQYAAGGAGGAGGTGGAATVDQFGNNALPVGGAGGPAGSPQSGPGSFNGSLGASGSAGNSGTVTPNAGMVGQPGTSGAGGAAAPTESGSTPVLTGGAGGGGGGGGGSGGGGASGISGAGGGGGAAGTYGQFNELDQINSGSGGQGGYGGAGGAGGSGGSGGAGGQGGGGGGAFEIIAEGEISANTGTILADGGAGATGTIGSAGYAGAAGEGGGPGAPGDPGASGTNLFFTGSVDGGTGGNGATGGAGDAGAAGGMGGTGGAGGGGAGGSVALLASVLQVSSLKISVAGGAGATAATDGAAGRVLLGSDASITTDPSTDGSESFYTAVAVSPNPYAGSSTIDTPNIPNLLGGPYAYGLLSGVTLTAADLAGTETIPSTSVAAVSLLSSNSPLLGSYAQNYPGYDVLVVVNLTSQPLEGPALSVGGGTPQALQYVDSTGTFTLSALNPGAVWAELVPTGPVDVKASLAPTSGQTYTTLVDAALQTTANANTAFIDATRPTLTSNSTPLSGFAAAVYSPNGQNIYAVDPADSTVVVLSAATGGVEQTITDGVAGYFGTSFPTQGLKGVDYVAVSPDGTVVYTGGPGGVDEFSVDPTTGQLTYFYTIGTTDLAATSGFSKFALPGSVNGLTAFTQPVFGGSDNNAVYISTSAGFSEWDYTYGEIPYEVAAGSLTNVVGQTAGVSDTEVYPSFTVQQQSVIYALGNGGTALDAILPFTTEFTNGNFTASVALPIAGTAVTTSPNGSFIYVASQSGNAITAVAQTSNNILNDPYSLTVVQTLTNGEDGVHGLATPSSLAVTPDGRYLLVGSEANSSLAVFSINQNTGALTYLQELREDVGGADGLADIAGLLAGATGSTTYALSLGNVASGAGGITPLAIATTPPAPVAYTITFSNIADVGLTLSGKGQNTITLAQPPSANVTTESITAGNGGNLINLQALAPNTIVNTGTGADTLNITAAQTGAALTANTGAGNDIINLYSAAANTVFTLSVGDGNDHFYVQGKGIAPSAGVELFADTASPLGDVLVFNPSDQTPNTPNFTPVNFSQTTGNLQVISFGVVKYSSFKQVIVENPPIITAPNIDTKEGEGVVLNATAVAVEGTLVGSLEYDLGNTGVFDVNGGSISAATLADYGITARGTYTVGVEAIDSDGGTAIAHFKIVVDAVNPVVSVTGAATAQVGSVYTIDLGATLAGTDAITGWEVNWNDGTTQTYGANVTDVTHTFETPGNFDIVAEAADSYSASGQYPYRASLPITVALPASFTLGQSTTISEGQGLTLVVPNDVPGTPNGYQWSINGRSIGGIQTGTTFSQTWAQLQASDGVTQAGTYTIGLSPGYRGSPPGTSLGTTSLVVLNTPPAVVVTPGSAVRIGADATFTLAVTSAASAVQAAGYTVEFDLFYANVLTSFIYETLAANGVVTVPAELIPPAVGGYEVLGEVYDREGGTTSFTDDFNVVAAPGTVVLNGSSLSTEGQTYDLSIDVIGGNTISGYVVNWGDGVTQTLQGGTTQTAAHVFLVNGSLAVDVTAIDTNTTYTAVQGVTVANVAPTLSLSAPASVPQGSSIALIGTITDPGPDDQFSLLINWDDGSQPTPIQLAPGVTAFATPHSYADVAAAGSYTITATVTDDDGATGTATLAETVTNVAPSISAIGFTSPTISEGGTATLVGLFTDPGTLDSHTALIDWGDGATSVGTVDAANDTFGGTHVYANNPPGQPDGSFAATAAITDNHGASDSAAAAETVRNVAPIITGATITPVAVIQGSAITVSATFTDPGTLDTHTALINWGDGDTTQAIVTESNGHGTVTATHSFDGAAPPAGQSFYTVTATVTDNDGASTSQVLDPPPIAENLMVSTPTINEGGAITLSGTVVDLAPIGGADTVDIIWGDGNTAQATISLATPTFDIAHTYLDNPTGEPDGSYRIQVVAANAIGNASTAATGVQVDNVAPTVNHLKLSTSHITEGSAVTLTGTIADPGVLDSETVSIVWGDGGTTAATVNLATRAFSATHTYLDNPPNQPDGSYSIAVTATDNAGAKGTASTSIEVDNVAPHITRLATNTGTVAAGGAVVLTGTVVDPGVLDSETVTVNWGDGTTSTASINRTTRVLSATHVYAAGSAGADTGYTITATAIDNSAGSGAAQAVVQVDTPPAPLALTLQAPATVTNTTTQDPTPVVAIAMAQPTQLITLLQSSPITVSSSNAADDTGVVSLVFDEYDGSFNVAQSVTTSLIDDYGEDWLLVSADPGDQQPSAG